MSSVLNGADGLVWLLCKISAIGSCCCSSLDNWQVYSIVGFFMEYHNVPQVWGLELLRCNWKQFQKLFYEPPADFFSNSKQKVCSGVVKTAFYKLRGTFWAFFKKNWICSPPFGKEVLLVREWICVRNVLRRKITRSITISCVFRIDRRYNLHANDSRKTI